MIYEPAEDSSLLAEEVKKYANGKSFLDMGTGSGIQSMAAKSSGAEKILSVDINEEAVTHVKKIGFKAIKSNLFSKVKGRFDLIAFNPPYLPEDEREDKESSLSTSGGEKGDEIILRFLKQSIKHLKSEGIILLLLSSLTPKKNILKLASKLKLKHRVLASKKIFMEELQVWLIERDKPLKVRKMSIYHEK